MEVKRFLVILAISLIIYFILDFVFSNAMLYIMGGVIVGTISAAFKAVGVKAGIVLIGLVWSLLLIGAVFLFYRLNNAALKYLFIILIAALLYVVDMFVANIPYSDAVDTENITATSKIIVGFLILLKSVILSVIIYTGIDRN